MAVGTITLVVGGSMLLVQPEQLSLRTTTALLIATVLSFAAVCAIIWPQSVDANAGLLPAFGQAQKWMVDSGIVFALLVIGIMASRKSLAFAAPLSLFALSTTVLSISLWSLELFLARSLPDSSHPLAVPERHVVAPAAVFKLFVALFAIAVVMVVYRTIVHFKRAGLAATYRDAGVSLPSVFGLFAAQLGMRRARSFMVFASPIVLIISVAISISDGMRDWAKGFASWSNPVAEWSFLALPIVAVWVVRRMRSSEAFRRNGGIVWDIATTWPSTYTPFVPPPYGARAVSDVVERVRHHNGEVLLAGHSQGSLICVLAARRLVQTPGQEVRLLTYGSPVGPLYQPLFGEALADVIDHVARNSRWINIYRPSDPLGGMIDHPGVDNRPLDPADGTGHGDYEATGAYQIAIADLSS